MGEQTTDGRTHSFIKAKHRVFVIVAVFLAISFLSSTVSAEEPETNSPPQEIGTAVAAPSGVQATSSQSDTTIVWVWQPPASGLTPDAPVDPPEEASLEQPTDIVQFGYELSTNDTVFPSGVVDVSTPTVTIQVAGSGTYSLKVWSITREGVFSEADIGVIAIAIPTELPPITEDLIPLPINTSTVVQPVIPGRVEPKTSSPQITNNNNGSQTNASVPSVLSANNVNTPVAPIEIAGVVKPSTQGWVILGIPWYIVAIVAGGMFVLWRIVLVSIKQRA